MLKLDKSIHFNILTIFAIVFVCVYLYYTISDLKKIAVEVKKHSQDITNIITNLATLNKDIADIKKNNGGTCQVGAGGAESAASAAKKAAAVVPKVTVTAVKTSADAAAASVVAATTTTTDNAVYDDQDLLNEIEAADAADADSVNTIEVKKMLSCLPGDDDDDDLDESPVADVLATVEDVPSHELADALEGSPYLADESTLSLKDLSVDELKKQTLDTLKTYCKENNLSTRGTKDVLIQLIKAQKN